MISQDKLLNELGRLVKRTRADAVSVIARTNTRRVFRFAFGAIHQDLIQESLRVTIQIIRNGRMGVSSTDSLEPNPLKRCVKRATEIAAHAPKSAEDRIPPTGGRLHSTKERHAPTARLTPSACVLAIQRLERFCQGSDARLAGSMLTGEEALAVVNSQGTSCYATGTIASAKLVTFYGALSGFASGTARRFDALDLDAMLQRSLRQCLHKTPPRTLPLGNYEVILEPEAVAELIEWLGYIAFSAKSLVERTSFLTNRMGQRLLDSSLTIYDDAHEAETLRQPFDCEGLPTQRVVLIDRGRPAAVVRDTLYGRRLGQPSTGHHLGPEGSEGPFPLNLAIIPGEKSRAAIIKSCKRGLLIPRFHYVNGLLNPREALMTGLLREGTFLVEDGKLTAPVTTMRFTQSLVDAFKEIVAISKERRLSADPATATGCALMPTLHLKSFRFTGRSTS